MTIKIKKDNLVGAGFFMVMTVTPLRFFVRQVRSGDDGNVFCGVWAVVGQPTAMTGFDNDSISYPCLLYIRFFYTFRIMQVGPE